MMRKEILEELKKDIEKLRCIVASCSTEPIVGLCAVKFISGSGLIEGLLSPFRQVFYLLGLMLTTPEPEKENQFDDTVWESVTKLLNSIFSAYTYLFWPEADSESSDETERLEKHKIAMEAFLSYFNLGILASAEQIKNRIDKYLSPFDQVLERECGINATNSLIMTSWIGVRLQKTVDDTKNVQINEAQIRNEILDKAQLKGWDRDRIRQEAKSSDWSIQFKKLSDGISQMLKIKKADLEKKFGNEMSKAFWDLYVVRRSEVSDYTYPTERNIAEEKPLFEISEGVAICPSINAVYIAVLRVQESLLLNSTRRESFLRKRDLALEEQTTILLKKLFGPEISILSGLYETDDLQYEHDVIVKCDKKLFVIEAKASPPREPFRDPEKSYVRLKRAFMSNRGIQKAYEQAHRIWEKHSNNEVICLYDEKRNLKLKIAPAEIDKVYCICLTRDNFGPLAIDLSMMLQKKSEDPFPWAVNILDLENFIDAWDYFGWGPSELCNYLDSREKLHGRITASDELDIAGAFIEHGGLHWITESKGDLILIPPTYSKVFDRIYWARRGGKEVKIAPKKPFIGDVKEMLKKDLKQTDATIKINQHKDIKAKQGRNKPCACGSGKKYKFCCGKVK